jgi:hypothetical protein
VGFCFTTNQAPAGATEYFLSLLRSLTVGKLHSHGSRRGLLSFCRSAAEDCLDSILRVMDFSFMNEASVIISRKSHAVLSRPPKTRRGAKGLLAHLREQTVSFPTIRRHRLPSK